MKESVIVTLILGLISTIGLLSIFISFFEKDFEEIEYAEEERSAAFIPIENELEDATYEYFFSDER
jgi:hypothetical protein